MTRKLISEYNPKVRNALNEIRGMIRERWPSATFQVGRGEDNPEAIHLNVTIDIKDTDEVMDVVIEKVLEFQIDMGLPIHVIPLRPVERVLEELNTVRASRKHRFWEKNLVPL